MSLQDVAYSVNGNGKGQRWMEEVKVSNVEVQEVGKIKDGTVYRYTGGFPADCNGALYKVHRMIVSVPAYSEMVLVEALNGPDKGLWFCCTPTNFVRRYEEVKDATAYKK